MIKLTILLLAIIALSWAQSDVETEWANFKTKHGKSYAGAEEASRKKIFATTHAQITAHNSKNLGYQMGHNFLSDMTQAERNQLLGAKPALAGKREMPLSAVIEDRQLPTALDYRNNTCLNAVKNQGSCGSCWAFTAITPLEFAKCKKTGTKITLSEQQLVDCDTSSSGCNGGWYTTAWNYLKNGAATSTAYPYTAVKGTCKFVSSTMTAAKTSSWAYVASKNPAAMQSALVTYGPLAVAMNVVNSFYSYKSGVYSDSTCTTTSVNHGVVVVGYGNLNGVNHWIVRNSWGSSWGSSGYILMRRGVNMCNVELYPAYVVSL